jgi:hypothetical protein
MSKQIIRASEAICEAQRHHFDLRRALEKEQLGCAMEAHRHIGRCLDIAERCLRGLSDNTVLEAPTSSGLSSGKSDGRSVSYAARQADVIRLFPSAAERAARVAELMPRAPVWNGGSVMAAGCRTPISRGACSGATICTNIWKMERRPQPQLHLPVAAVARPAPGGARSADPWSSACRSRGRNATSAASAANSGAPRMPEMASAADGEWRSCTSASASSDAVSAAGWPTRANAKTRSIELSANRRRSGFGSVVGRVSSTFFRISRRACIGGPMVGCSIRPRRRRSTGSLWSVITCASEQTTGCRSQRNRPMHGPIRRMRPGRCSI